MYRLFSFIFPNGGDENPRPGVDNGRSPLDGMAAGHDARRASEASQSPPHRHISDESRYLCIGSFLLYSSMGGMRIPDRGSTTGAARWTEWPQAMTPAGRAKRVNPPLTAIFQMRAGTYVSALFFYIPQWGDENPRPGVDNGRSPLDGMAAGHDARRASEASQSPPHRHISDKSRYLCIGSFLLYSPMGGMRIPDQGSTTSEASQSPSPPYVTFA